MRPFLLGSAFVMCINIAGAIQIAKLKIAFVEALIVAAEIGIVIALEFRARFRA